MSRIGRQPIEIPAGVTVTVDNNLVTATGPKGTLQRLVDKKLEIKIENNTVNIINPTKEDSSAKALHGLFRQLVNNMIIGVAKGFEKKIVVNGVGYRVNLKSPTEATLTVGFSHPVELVAIDGVTFEADKNTLTVKGIDKELVGKYASSVRDIKPVEPYHGYGIKYEDEVVRRKVAKSGKK